MFTGYRVPVTEMHHFASRKTEDNNDKTKNCQTIDYLVTFNFIGVSLDLINDG